MVASSLFVFLTLQSLFIPFSFIIQSLKIVVTLSLKQDALGRNLLLFSAQVFFQTGLFPHLFHALLLPLHTTPHTVSLHPQHICRVAVLFLFHTAYADTTAPSTPSISCDIKPMSHICLVLFPRLPHACKSRSHAFGVRRTRATLHPPLLPIGHATCRGCLSSNSSDHRSGLSQVLKS